MTSTSAWGTKVDRAGHLAVVVPNMGGGGAERVVVNLLDGFVTAGLRVDLLLVRATGPLLSEVPSGVRIHELQGGRIIASLPSLVRYLRREKPDALLSHLDTMNIVALIACRIARSRVRTVVTTHVALSQHARGGSIRQRIAARLVGRLYPWADAVVGVSRGVVADLQRRIGHREVPTEVIYNPIVSNDLLDRVNLRASSGRPPLPSGVPRGRRLILSAGRLTPQKHHALLIDAFALVADEHVDTHLVVLGDGPLRSQLSAQIAELGLQGRITLPGFIADPTEYFAAASLFVLSSRWEGLPTVLIEALVFGCPIVSTRCPSGPEEILEGGTYGRLVPMDDPHAMAQGIRDVLADPPEPELLRRRARDFGFEQSVSKYLALLFPDERRH